MNFLRSFGKTNPGSLQNHFLRCHRHWFREKKIWKNTLLFDLGSLANSFWTFGRKNHASLSKLHFTCPEALFWSKFTAYEKQKCSKLFWSLRGFVWRFWRKESNRVVKSAFYVTRGTFWGKMMFSEKNLLLIIFSFLTELFGLKSFRFRPGWKQ